MPKQRKRIKLTWAELKQQRNAQERFELYLPMLQLKQQQLQQALGQVRQEHDRVAAEATTLEKRIAIYAPVLQDRAGLNVPQLARPQEVQSTTGNIAGVRVSVFQSVVFAEARYSLFSTPPWVDQALADLRKRNQALAQLEILRATVDLLEQELKRVMQRVNLFEKVILPQTRENIRRIRIALGDMMTAAVARAKMAKAKLEKREQEGREEEAPV